MKYIKRWLIPLLTLGLVALLPMTAFAETAQLNNAQIDTIKQNCTSAQLTLEQLQKRDAVSRINRGRAYDQMLRQISAFNSRLAYNKINLSQFVQLASDLQTHVDHFRTNYSTYDETLSNATKINCKDKPTDFYDLVVKTRNQRASIGSEISELEQLGNSYRDALIQYQATLPADMTQRVGQ